VIKSGLQVSNGGASSYFWLRYAGGKITVVANDGNDVEPVEVDRLLIAVSETYDIVLTIPENNKSYELMATTEDRTQSASYFLGNGVKKHIGALPKLKYFDGMKMMNDMMKMNGEMDDMGMSMSLQQMDMNNVMYPEITGEEKGKVWMA
jgi:FtsP/CotA-like multicopper oxidase with cupredoxin domain